MSPHHQSLMSARGDNFVLAMKHRIGFGQLAATIHTYPTFAESGRKVGDRYKKRLTPFLKYAFTWLYRRSREAG
jgi:hypothetical protein